MNNITYSQLRETHINKLTVSGSSVQEIRNHISILKMWMECFSKNDWDEASEFRYFQESVEYFFKHKSYSPQSIPSRKYLLNSFKKTYLSLCTESETPRGFAERLRFFMDRKCVTQSELAEALNVRVAMINNWYWGTCCPSFKNYGIVLQIEMRLGLPVGMLTSAILHFHGQARSNLHSGNSYSELQRSRAKLRFKLNFNLWPPKARHQWELLKNHHTNLKPPLLPRHPFAIWRRPTTVRSRLQRFETFFGFLVLPRSKGGIGMKVSNLDLRLIAQVNKDGALKYFEPFMEFSRSRSPLEKHAEGVYTNSLKRDLTVLTTYLTRKNGFFRNSKHFNTSRQWDTIFDLAIQRTVRLLRGTEFVQTRFPKENIGSFLKDQHPIRFLIEMLKKMEKDIAASEDRYYYKTWMSMHFVCAFLTGIPLRSSMLCKMKFDQNLYKTKSGWRLRFPTEEFKNFKGAAKDREYDIACPCWLNPIIDKYVEFRKTLPDGGIDERGNYECNYVIRPSCPPKNKIPKEPVCTAVIYNWCTQATSKYIRNCCGFGPHGWRHILATDYIKNNVDGFVMAAYVLHDTTETVRKNYAHLETDDYIKHYNKYSENMYSSFSIS
jgi:integrase